MFSGPVTQTAPKNSRSFYWQ